MTVPGLLCDILIGDHHVALGAIGFPGRLINTMDNLAQCGFLWENGSVGVWIGRTAAGHSAQLVERKLP
jgi:hypothetical protein